MGRAATTKPFGGSWSRFATFSKPDATVIQPNPSATVVYERLEGEFATRLKEYLASESA